MGWQDAPAVEASPKWMSAPAVDSKQYASEVPQPGGRNLSAEPLPQRSEAPRERPSWGDVALSAPNQAVAGLADAVTNFPAHATNFGKSFVNKGFEISGRPAPFQITQPERSVEQFYKNNGMIAGDIENMAPAQRIVNTALQSATLAAASPAAGARQFVGNALRATAGGGAGQAAEEVTGNPLVGLGVSVATPAGIGVVEQKAQAAARLAQARNAVRDATLKDAQAAGYLVTPGSANPTVGNVSLERLGGKQRLEQNMSVHNQQVTNNIVRKDLGLATDQAIDEKVLQQIRKDEYARGYEPVKQVGQINTDRTLVNDLARIKNDYSGTASFPKPVVDAVEQEVSRFQKLNFTAADAVDEARSLRSQATRNIGSDDVEKNALGLAQVKIADALENQIERQLAANPATAGLVDQYKQSRRLMAKTHAVEDALVLGSGDVSTAKLAQLRERGVPMDAGLKIAADFGNVFKHVNRPPSSFGTPGGGGLIYGGTGTAGGGAAYLASGGDPLMTAAGAMTGVGIGAGLRGGARALLQSKFGQGRATPAYERQLRNALADTPDNPVVNALYYGAQATPFAGR